MLVPSLCETFLTITHVTGLCTHGLTSSQDCFYTMQEVDIQNWGRALSQFVQVVWCCEAPCAILTFEVILLIVAPTLFWCVTFNASLMPYWFVRNFYCNLALDFATLSQRAAFLTQDFTFPPPRATSSPNFNVAVVLLLSECCVSMLCLNIVIGGAGGGMPTLWLEVREVGCKHCESWVKNSALGKHYDVWRADQSRDTNQLSHRQMYLAEHWRMHTYRCTYMYD